jgi:hypothetical protein
MPLLHLPLPSLIFLDVKFENPHLFQNSVKSFPEFSPNIRSISIRIFQLENTFKKIEPSYICRWRNLCSVICPQVALDVEALVQLSRMPALTRLAFALGATFPASDSPLLFSNLHDLIVHSRSLDPISRLLSQTRLPVITNFTAYINDYPSRQELSSFLAGVPASNAHYTIETLRLTQPFPPSSNVLRSESPLLGLEDLRPCMVLSNLRHIELNIEWNVDLTDNQVLMLASAWPKLEHFLINEDWGWNSRGGITPDGLLQLLQTCRSLSGIALALDTRGYTESCPNETPACLGLTLPREFSIDVVDSIIEAESVPAVGTFFSGIAACSKSDISFYAWGSEWMVEFPNMGEYMGRWYDVHSRIVGGRFESGDSHQAIRP